MQEGGLDEKVILFDGVCNFCNAGVDFLANADNKGLYTFTALQSERGKYLLETVGLPRDFLSSIVLISLTKTNRGAAPVIESVQLQSDVFVSILKSLGGVYKVLGDIAGVLPKNVRDVLYDMIAANRYSFMGRRENCRCGEWKSGK
jgi:predicted DCC family thiol-disulfide oxidoreductase YuxK